MKRLLSGILVLCFSPAFAGMADDPLLTKVMIDQAELRLNKGDNPFVVEADAWVGKDLNKAWFKLDFEKVGDKVEQLELQALYSKAVTTYWDVQTGIRHDVKPSAETRDWAVIGVRGLAPYYFDIDSSVAVSTHGQINLNVNAEYEAMITQRLVLTPELQFNLYSQDDLAIDQGSGLADAELGLRLSYAFKREFAPYIGVNWERKFGQTASLVRAAGDSTDTLQFVLGIRAWF